jgi:hypothetical protein
MSINDRRGRWSTLVDCHVKRNATMSPAAAHRGIAHVQKQRQSNRDSSEGLTAGCGSTACERCQNASCVQLQHQYVRSIAPGRYRQSAGSQNVRSSGADARIAVQSIEHQHYHTAAPGHDQGRRGCRRVALSAACQPPMHCAQDGEGGSAHGGRQPGSSQQNSRQACCGSLGCRRHIE